MPSSDPLAFGGFTLDPYCRVLQFGSQTVPLKPKELDLLLVLAGSSGSVVSKEAIMFALWEHQAVSEAALTQTVYRLRRVLAAYDPQRRYIATIPRRGYQLVQRVSDAAIGPIRRESAAV